MKNFSKNLVSSEGINPDQGKIDIITNFRSPSNKEELRSFLATVTYVGKFIPSEFRPRKMQSLFGANTRMKLSKN